MDILSGHLYKKPPKRNYGDLSSEVVPPRVPKTLFDSFWNNCDFEGSTFDQFIRDAQRFASVYGRVSVIVDSPSGEALTEAEALEKDMRPYLTLITPENLTDWQFTRGDSGRPELSVIKILEVNNKEVKHYRIWGRNTWELWEIKKKEKEGTLIGNGEHGLGEIPIVNFYNKRSGIKMIGLSDIKDIADINKNVYHLCSDAKEIIENTAFPMLAVPYEKGGGSSEIEVGPKNILQFDPETANAKPFWLEAPHSSLTEIREWVIQDATEITRMAMMGGMRNVESSTQPWSGVSIESQAQQLFAALVEKADNAEQAELDILRLYAKWQDKPFAGTVVYPRDFSVRDVTIALQNALNAKTAGITSLTFEKERQKIIVAATLPLAEEVTTSTIYKEIEEGAVVTLPEEEIIEFPDKEKENQTQEVAAETGDIQAEALNGAQISSLVEIVLAASNKQMPINTAEAIIEAAFPLLDKGIVNSIINGLKGFTPPKVGDGTLPEKK